MFKDKFTLMPCFVALCFFVVASLGIPRLSFAAHEIQVLTEYLPKYQIRLDDGELGGFATEVVQAMFAITGDTPEVQVLPWARAYQRALVEKNLMIYSLARTEMREPQFHWIGALNSERVGFYGLSTRFNAPIASIAELAMMQIATTKNSNPELYLSTQGFKRLYRVSEELVGYGLLFKGRTDLIVASEVGLHDNLKQLKQPQDSVIKVFEIPELNSHLHIAFSKRSDPEIVAHYRSAYAQLRASGKFTELRQAWFGNP